jgi:5,10-methylene-tetrahydrofolate dehydrogenase/methenyl tetrahydrofolate cyclohydrolase
MYKLLDGKLISEQIKTEIAEEVKRMMEAGMKRPHWQSLLWDTTAAVNHT